MSNLSILLLALAMFIPVLVGSIYLGLRSDRKYRESSRRKAKADSAWLDGKL